MAGTSDPDGLTDAAERLFDEMIAQQRAKVAALARRLHPEATPEDLLNPEGVPALREDAGFNYEDGILAGLLAARAAVRARLLRGGG